MSCLMAHGKTHALIKNKADRLRGNSITAPAQVCVDLMQPGFAAPITSRKTGSADSS